MESDRKDTRQARTSAIGNSLAYAAALTRLYAGYLDSWRASMGWKKPAGTPSSERHEQWRTDAARRAHDELPREK